MKRCTIRANADKASQCVRAAVIHITSGCVHEHITNNARCVLHATTEANCGRCYGADGHRCRLTILDTSEVAA